MNHISAPCCEIAKKSAALLDGDGHSIRYVGMLHILASRPTDPDIGRNQKMLRARQVAMHEIEKRFAILMSLLETHMEQFENLSCSYITYRNAQTLSSRYLNCIKLFTKRIIVILICRLWKRFTSVSFVLLLCRGCLVRQCTRPTRV